jgi:hypothetical protein
MTVLKVWFENMLILQITGISYKVQFERKETWKTEDRTIKCISFEKCIKLIWLNILSEI